MGFIKCRLKVPSSAVQKPSHRQKGYDSREGIPLGPLRKNICETEYLGEL